MTDERRSRRPSFREGSNIPLADDQLWTLPAPRRQTDADSVCFESEYTGLIQAIIHAEDSSEQRLAELALVILLLGHNYYLSPADYERLLDFGPNTPESIAAQLAFHDVAEEHVRSFLSSSEVSTDRSPAVSAPGRFSSAIAWLRNHMPFGWWSFDS